MRSRVKYVSDIESLEDTLSKINYFKPFNIRVGEATGSFCDSYSSISDYTFSILIDSNFYDRCCDKIEEVLKSKAELRKQKMIELIGNGKCNFEDSTYISIDKYHYDEEFIRNIINLESDKCIVLSFFDVKPSDELMFLLKKNKVVVYLYNKKFEYDEISKNWFTKRDFDEWSNNDVYESISYDKLINNLDCLNEFFNLEGFSISNVCSNSSDKFYKCEMNSVYLDNLFKVIRMFRKRGYDKPINIECDSYYDISRSFFRYDSLGVTFGGSELNMRSLNSYISKYNKVAYENLYDGLSLSDKLNYIYVTLADIIESQKEKRDKIDMSFFSKEVINHTYDLCRLFGLNPIKCPGTSDYYFFEAHNPRVVKFNPETVNFIFDMNGVDIYDVDSERKAWNLVYNSYSDVDSNNLYDKYLNAKDVEEFKEIFIDSINLKDGLYLSVKDRYIEGINYLLNILMDLSPEDYLEFKNSFYSYNSINDVISACEVVAGMILKNKKKQIGIVMTKKKVSVL